MTENFIPFARPDIGDAEIQAVVDSLRSGWLTTGPKAKQLEDEFAGAVGARFAVAVNSGTAAMHLALEALGIEAGDEVLTTDYTFTATAEVIRYLRADPIFVDINLDTLNLNIEQVEQTLQAKPAIKAILPVHFGGRSCDMSALGALAKRFGVHLIDDAAHAFPATSGGVKIGSIADATAFSFYATKTLAVGEGGMLTTNSERIADRARIMRLHGISRDVFDRYTSRKPSWQYEVVAPGFKYNMTDVAAAIGLQQLGRTAEMHAHRRAIAQRYLEALRDLPLDLPIVQGDNDVHAWHLFVIQLRLEELSIDRNQFIQKMAEYGVGTSVHFIPLHRQPYWRDRYRLTPKQYPVAEHVFQRCVSLPLYSALSSEDVETIIRIVKRILSDHTVQ